MDPDEKVTAGAPLGPKRIAQPVRNRGYGDNGSTSRLLRENFGSNPNSSKGFVLKIDEDEAKELGYSPTRMLPTGEVAGVMAFIFTYGLCTGMDEWGYTRRWCYPTRFSAKAALETWDGKGDPPGPWIKYKGVDGERTNAIFLNQKTGGAAL
jgi:hypothetical protein